MESTPMRRAMTDQSVTFRELAFLTGLSAGYLSRVAKHPFDPERRRPSRPAALRIARALGIPPEAVHDPQPQEATA